MKTAMQELIEKLKAQQKILEKEDSIVLAAALYAGQRMAEELLEKEKEQFYDMFEEGFESAYQHFVNGEDFVKFEEYYNQTYNQK